MSFFNFLSIDKSYLINASNNELREIIDFGFVLNDFEYVYF